jgi:hypothetical protein
VAHGLRAVVVGPRGESIADVTIPAGAYDRRTGVGWKQVGQGWAFASRTLVGGLVKEAVIRAGKSHVTFTISGRGASTFGALPALPLSLTVIEPATHACARAQFDGPEPSPICTLSKGTGVRCR